MKVLYFISEQNFGLTSLFVGNAISLNKIQDIDFIFITGSTEKEDGLFQKLINSNVNFYKINGLEYHIDFKRQAKELFFIIKKINPLCIHVQTNWQLALLLYVKYFYKLKFKIYFTVHHFRNNSFIKSYFARLIMGSVLLFFANKIFVCSSYTKRKFGLLSYKTKLLFLGIDNGFFSKNENLDLKFDQNINILFPGEFRRGKNQKLIINVISKFIRKHKTNQIKLILPGNGKYLNDCINLVDSLGIKEFVSFPGFLNKEQVISEIKNCSIVVVPSNSETFSLVTAEAFSFGRCVISRNVGVAPDIIKHGYNGYIFNKENELFVILENLYFNRNFIHTTANNAFGQRMIFNWDNIAKGYRRHILF